MNYTDLKLYTINSIVMAISLSNIEVALKIMLLIVTIGYTSYKWISIIKDKANEGK